MKPARAGSDVIVICLLAWLLSAGKAGPPAAPAEPAAPEAVGARLREGLDRLRAKAGAPPLGHRAELDAAAGARAADIAALPMETRLGRKDPIDPFLRRHGIRRFERAEARVAILGGYADPASEALTQWADSPDSRLLDRRWTAAGTAVAEARDGVFVIVAVFLQDASAPQDMRALEREVENAVNEVRKSRGRPPLAVSEPLRDAARAHSADMARRGYVDHVSPEGQGPAERVRARDLAYRKVSENIAMNRGEDDPVRSAVEGWVMSPGHLKNLLDTEVRETGVGIAVDEDGALYFTQLFLDPAGP
jgi:uncharacterized protein YkwD